MVDWVGQVKGLALPAAYIMVIVGLMATFSSLYRKRQAVKAASLEPWFPPHTARDIYLSLLHMEQTEPGKEKPLTVPDSIVKAALLRRAVEDINRIVALRSSKQALQSLLQRGSVGDDLWQRFERAEKELQAELEDVVSEANALAPNWGQSIFQSANEMAANARLRERIDELQGQVSEEKAWYERRRASAAKELLESSDDDDEEEEGEGVLVEDAKDNKALGSPTATTTAAAAAAATSTATTNAAGSSTTTASSPTATGEKKKKKKNKGKK